MSQFHFTVQQKDIMHNNIGNTMNKSCSSNSNIGITNNMNNTKCCWKQRPLTLTTTQLNSTQVDTRRNKTFRAHVQSNAKHLAEIKQNMPLRNEWKTLELLGKLFLKMLRHGQTDGRTNGRMDSLSDWPLFVSEFGIGITRVIGVDLLGTDTDEQPVGRTDRWMVFMPVARTWLKSNEVIDIILKTICAAHDQLPF